MPRLPRWTAAQAERELLRNGFQLLRSKGSHRIYFKNGVRVVLPFHSGRDLHPKVIRQVIDATEGPEQLPITL
jgi:predicted RNA binding protein YcfA (HicA-like mRNA interferase family)